MFYGTELYAFRKSLFMISIILRADNYVSLSKTDEDVEEEKATSGGERSGISSTPKGVSEKMASRVCLI